MLSFFAQKKKKASKKLIEFLKRQEGLSLSSYQDDKGVWTIGYGHTGKDVGPGQTITQEQADAFLAADIAWAEAAINNNVKSSLLENQFDALVSLVYNIGASAFKGSTLLVYLNQEKYELAAKEFCRWIYTDSRVNKGLVKRRCHESLVFAAAIY